ncbi:MAG: hypothetical protein methR_P1049 [Methyloprofundus sp.]|nr:MAG: hypothetical protein methR_P1049 [Methyloprofundus sp.]
MIANNIDSIKMRGLTKENTIKTPKSKRTGKSCQTMEPAWNNKQQYKNYNNLFSGFLSSRPTASLVISLAASAGVHLPPTPTVAFIAALLAASPAHSQDLVHLQYSLY